VEVRAVSNVALADPSPDPSTPEPWVRDSAADSTAQADEKKAGADRTEAAEAQAATPISHLPPSVA
jgi:hypothetical protein